MFVIWKECLGFIFLGQNHDIATVQSQCFICCIINHFNGEVLKTRVPSTKENQEEPENFNIFGRKPIPSCTWFIGIFLWKANGSELYMWYSSNLCSEVMPGNVKQSEGIQILLATGKPEKSVFILNFKLLLSRGYFVSLLTFQIFRKDSLPWIIGQIAAIF